MGMETLAAGRSAGSSWLLIPLLAALCPLSLAQTPDDGAAPPADPPPAAADAGAGDAADAKPATPSPSLLSDFSTQSSSYMTIWRDALQALLARDRDAAEGAFAQLLERDISAFRVALLADESIRRGGLGGGVLLLEQDAKLNRLGEKGQQVAALLETGREQVNQADDGFYFAAIGRFDVANANFRALLDSKPDAVAVLEFADARPSRKRVLMQIVNKPAVAETAREMARLLEMGEVGIKADPRRIRTNIERLGGPPRGFENALAALKESGEFAVPFMLEYLNNPERRELVRPILRALPQLDRPALNPLIASLKMPDGPTKLYVIDVIGAIGYRQALPALLKLRDAEGTAPDTRRAVERAIQQISAKESGAGVRPAADEYFGLAELYYKDSSSLAADVRVPQAQVWVWNDGFVQNLAVPTPIFDEVMAMRAAEEALLLNPDHKGALSLWLAANFRRAAQLPEGQTDVTRPENDPSPTYYAQSAGAEYCLMALQRGVANNEAAVALGCIEALRHTAGKSSLAGKGVGAGPLAEALTFKERLVRVRAALALGRVGLSEQFAGYQNVVPALAEALQLGATKRGALVIEGDDTEANRIAGALRSAGYEVVSDANLLAGLQKARTELPSVDVVVLAGDMQNPTLTDGVAEVRKDYRFTGAPVLINVKEGSERIARKLQDGDPRIGTLPKVDEPEMLQAQISKSGWAAGVGPLSEEDAAAIALEAAETLARLGGADAKLYDLKQAEAALTAAVKGGGSAELRTAAAGALAFVATDSAQETLAKLAGSADEEESLRVAMYDALAQAGRAHGNLLKGPAVEALVNTVASEGNLTLREAASRALGALNVGGNPASKIIRDQHRG